MKRYLTLILVSIGLLGLAACGKSDEKPDKKGADITAELILESGEKIDFSYSMDNYDFFHGPDAEGNGYIIQLYPRTTIDGTSYSIMIDARIKGAGKAGEGSYSFHETLGHDDMGVLIRVGVQSDPADIATLEAYNSAVGNPGGLVITSFSDHHIAGTFSGIMNSEIVADAPSVRIQNGKFEFDF